MGETEGATAMALAVAQRHPGHQDGACGEERQPDLRLYAHSQDDALRMAGESLNRVYNP